MVARRIGEVRIGGPLIGLAFIVLAALAIQLCGSPTTQLVAARKPLVMVSGQTEQIPDTDYLSSPGGASFNGTASTTGDVEATTMNHRTPLTEVAGTSVVGDWGDSLTRGAGSTGGTGYPLDFAALTGWFAFNGGVDGQTSTQIMTRMLAATAKHSWPTVIWAGRNNYAAGATVQSNIASMVASLTTTNYIVLSILNSDASSEWAGQPNYNLIIALNNALSATYGSHYLDVRAYLVSLYNPAIPQDVIDHGHDVPPSSLRSDSVHLNDAGYADVAAYINTHIALLTADPTPPNLAGLVAKYGSTTGTLMPTTGVSEASTVLSITEPMTVLDGTAAVPAITVGASTNSGIYSNAGAVTLTNGGFDIIRASVLGAVLEGATQVDERVISSTGFPGTVCNGSGTTTFGGGFWKGNLGVAGDVTTCALTFSHTLSSCVVGFRAPHFNTTTGNGPTFAYSGAVLTMTAAATTVLGGFDWDCSSTN